MSNDIKQNFEYQIEELIDIITNLSKDIESNDEIVSDLCRYLCVLISGYFEKTFIHILLKNYIKRRVPDSIYKFINSKLKGSTNFNKSKVEELLKSFDSKWVDQLKSWDNYDSFGDVIGSIYSNRNKIAHGENTTVSIRDMKNDYEILKEFFEKLVRVISHKVK